MKGLRLAALGLSSILLVGSFGSGFIPIDRQQASAPDRRGTIQAAGDEYWDAQFGDFYTDGFVFAVAVSGTDVYVGGGFDYAGSCPANSIAKWNGTIWSPLGGGTNAGVRAIAVSGTDVYAGGYFTQAGGVTANHIAKWDGSNWSPLGSGVNSDVFAIAVNGTDVYVGGNFTTAGGAPANYIAKWDGTNWSPLGSGVNGWVYAIAVSGTDVFVGGNFTQAGGASIPCIAKWDGASWSGLGSGVNGEVDVITMNGTEMYVGGSFTKAAGSWSECLAKWDISSNTWTSMGGFRVSDPYDPWPCNVFAIAVNGTEVYAGGSFNRIGIQPVNYIAKWDGTSWSGLGSGLSTWVRAMGLSGSELYAGGDFTHAGGTPANRIAKWNGTNWLALAGGLNNYVWAISISGPNAYVGGDFTKAGGLDMAANYVARWNGTNWRWPGLYYYLNSAVYAIASSGTDAYIGGNFTTAAGFPADHIIQWDGTTWSPLGSGVNDRVWAIAAVSGTDVYVGGDFTQAGGAAANHIARWDGTSWSTLGAGVNGPIWAIAVSGTDVYAGGLFTQAGGAPANYIAKWDGTSWSALGNGVNSQVIAIEMSGTDAYVGGDFTQAGGVAANHIAKWDGSSWSALGAGGNGSVWAIEVSGTDVYAGGRFTQAGGVPANHIAKWDGMSWWALGSGVDNWVKAIAISGTDLYVGGGFTHAGGKPSYYFGRWMIPFSVTSPNGGENWLVGSAHNITWTSAGSIANVRIEYSTNSGSSYSTIVASTPNDGTHPWIIPNTPSTACLVRVSDASNPVTYDVSNAVFAISAIAPPAISLSRTNLYYGSSSAGISSKTQSVIISNSGGGGLNWTAIPQQGWISVMPASGTGTRAVDVSVNTSGLGTGTHAGSIVVSDPSASNSPQSINVTLRVYDAGATTSPFGYFETPIDGTTGIEGSVPVTGWALDDIEVTKVDIWRDPVAGEPVHPNGYVYIGDAVFVEGARPDVEAAYPAYPLNYRAGWGYMMLTNFLPGQGNGTYRIHAIAHDKEGNSAKVGTKTITCDNARAALPFGAIDTPAQGGTWNGTQVNFGWALTPMPKSIPVDGSTIWLWIDGLPVGHPTYNNYREDIATLFPGFANSNGAVGYYYVDTTQCANSVHTIAWSVEDSAGKASGIGSRYFTVVNTGTGSAGGFGEAAGPGLESEDKLEAAATAADQASIPADKLSPVYVRKGYKLDALAERVFPDAEGVITIETREVGRVEVALTEEGAGEGLAQGTPDKKMAARAKTREALLQDKKPSRPTDEQGYAGYLVVGSQLRPLPTGSTFDSRRGVFSWQLGPGFVGEYSFVFINQGGAGGQTKKNIRVRILPAFQLKESPEQPPAPPNQR